MPIGKRVGAEILGTFMLVFMGCGAAMMAASMPGLGIGTIGVALAFGLAVLAMSYALGHVSGAHLNPAVTVGAFIARRFPARDVMPYILAQVAGAVLGAVALYIVASGKAGPSMAGLAANGFGAQSPSGFEMAACMVTEIVLTFGVVLTFLATNERRSLMAHAPIAVGLAVALAMLVAGPVTGGSINPARSTAGAIFAGAAAATQLWMFWIAPLIGGALAGVIAPLLSRTPQNEVPEP